MKAVVVICIDSSKQTCHAEISLAYAIDRWWYKKRGITCIQVSPLLPLYQAIYLRDRVAAKVAQECNHEWSNNEIVEHMTNCFIHEMSSTNDKWHSHLDKLWHKAVWDDSQAAVHDWSERVLNTDAMQVLPYIEGRRWLFEHLEKRLKMIGIRLHGSGYNEERNRSYLYLIVQYLFLKGEIEITSGITLHTHKKNIRVKCERCGSEEYGIHLHYCTFCGQDDPVCDTCYVMGVSKGCSLVISRPKGEHAHLHEVIAGSEEKWNGQL